jgi:effector-binding domain-containing protein
MCLAMRTALALTLVLATSCSTPRTLDGVVRQRVPTGPEPLNIPVDAALHTIDANWKERLAQPYVYVDHVGDYRRMGDAMRRVFASAEKADLQPTGAPFALFFDDPSRVPAGELRARACIPIAQRPLAMPRGLSFDELPRSMVVYARVPGAYPEVSRAYPALFAYLRELGWRQGGPVREVYLVNPVEARSYDELLTEVQIPWVAENG